jgi:hypothetical protein
VCGANAFKTAIQVNYAQTFDVVMKSGSDSTVAFKNHPPNLTAVPTDFPSGWDRFWLGDHVPTAVFDGIQTALAGTLDFTVPDVKTFALTSLLFPSLHVVHLQDVALDCGPLPHWQPRPANQLVSRQHELTPGQSIQLSVAGIPTSEVLWKPPRIGSISATGYYTAPASIRSAEVVIITAVDASDANSTGSAMVLVYQSPAAGGVAVAPGSSLVTPGQQVQLSTHGCIRESGVRELEALA